MGSGSRLVVFKEKFRKLSPDLSFNLKASSEIQSIFINIALERLCTRSKNNFVEEDHHKGFISRNVVVYTARLGQCIIWNVGSHFQSINVISLVFLLLLSILFICVFGRFLSIS